MGFHGYNGGISSVSASRWWQSCGMSSRSTKLPESCGRKQANTGLGLFERQRRKIRGARVVPGQELGHVYCKLEFASFCCIVHHFSGFVSSKRRRLRINSRQNRRRRIVSRITGASKGQRTPRIDTGRYFQDRLPGVRFQTATTRRHSLLGRLQDFTPVPHPIILVSAMMFVRADSFLRQPGSGVQVR